MVAASRQSDGYLRRWKTEERNEPGLEDERMVRGDVWFAGDHVEGSTEDLAVFERLEECVVVDDRALKQIQRTKRRQLL